MAKELTFILAGKLGVGKTSLFRRIQTGTYVCTPERLALTSSQVNHVKSEEELEYCLYNVTLGGQEYKISLWDTGGLERYHSMTANYFRFCHCVILVYDTRPDCIHTLFVLRDWVNDARKNNFLGEGMALSLWANKADDLSHEEHVRPEEVTAFMGEYNIPDSLYFHVSAKTGYNVMESFHTLIEHVSNHAPNNGHIISSTSTAPDTNTNTTIPQQEQRRRCKC